MMDWDSGDEGDSHSTVDFQQVKSGVSQTGNHARSSMRGLQTVLAEGILPILRRFPQLILHG